MRIILKYPILATLLFILLFEFIFQHNMFLLLYFALIYVAISTAGYIKPIRRILLATYKKILKWLTTKPKASNNSEIDIIFRNENGLVEGNFYVKSVDKSYLIKAVRDYDNLEVRVRINDVTNQKADIKVLSFDDFYITKNAVLSRVKKYLA